MSIKRHITALFHRERCEREILIPMLDKLTERERMALWRLLQEKERQKYEKKKYW